MSLSPIDDIHKIVVTTPIAYYVIQSIHLKTYKVLFHLATKKSEKRTGSKFTCKFMREMWKLLREGLKFTVPREE